MLGKRRYCDPYGIKSQLGRQGPGGGERGGEGWGGAAEHRDVAYLLVEDRSGPHLSHLYTALSL